MIIDIDLGTTNSLAAVWRNRQSELTPNALGKFLTPNVACVDGDDMVLTGEAVRNLQLIKPQNYASSFRRTVGTSETLKLGRREFRAEELSSLILRQLKENAENYLGEEVTEAMISIPAYLGGMQRRAIKTAATMAGLNVERLINEPTAAALAYGLHNKNGEHQFLVFDSGGGTSDVSILELFGSIMGVRTSAGDNFLGGEDITDILIDAYYSRRDLLENIEWREPALQRHLRIETERVKRVLSVQGEATFSVEIKGRRYYWHLTTEKFESSLQTFFERTHMPPEQAIRDAKISFSQLDRVVLMGDTTRMPLTRRLVTRLFGCIPTMYLDPDGTIAQDVAIQVALKARHNELRDVVATDTCPYTLGVDTSKSLGHTREPDYFAPVIERNRNIPCNRARVFYTTHDQQTEVNFKIYQGESRMVADNIFLAELSVNTPPKPAGNVRVDVRFTYDINGILDVDISVPLTGVKNSLAIEQNLRALAAEQIQQSLPKLSLLKIHPRGGQIDQTFTARLDNLYQLTLAETRDWISNYSRRFSYLLEKQDPDQLADFRTKVEPTLDSLGRERLQ